jgi:single-stranded-DNA-specific exonuclease
MTPALSRWIFPAADPLAAGRLAAALGIGAPAARVLISRGFTGPDEARVFIEASLDHLHDPLAMRDMERAAARLEKAVRAREKILIYGDYDVDGATSVALLIKAIQMAGGDAGWHVPHRLKDGYGMRPEAVEAAAARGVTLIVSVDTGIRAAEVVRRAAGLGVDVIVTDHHLPDAEPPPAFAVLNPNRADCAYPDKNLCGAGVAFKLAQAFLARLSWPPEKLRRVSESFLKIVALATVADVVPLTGENRIIVKQGLAGLRSVRNPGLRALLQVAGVAADTAPSARQVAFQIAPRINAAGRMDTAEAVVELFLTADPDRARALAEQLDRQNAERRQVEAGIQEACERAPVDESAAALVYYDGAWHRGVLGIVASRLVERRRRPVFVLGRNPDDGLVQGSGRSIPAFHLLDALDSMPDLFVRYGGHQHAAGVTLEESRVAEFRERFNAYAAARLGPQDFAPMVQIDAEVELREIDERAANGVFALAPFGHGNPPPLFAASNVEVAGPPVIFGEKHLRITVRQNNRTLALKAWNFAARAGEFAAGARIDIAFMLEEDPYSAARNFPGWCAVLREARAALRQQKHLATL